MLLALSHVQSFLTRENYAPILGGSSPGQPGDFMVISCLAPNWFTRQLIACCTSVPPPPPSLFSLSLLVPCHIRLRTLSQRSNNISGFESPKNVIRQVGKTMFRNDCSIGSSHHMTIMTQHYFRIDLGSCRCRERERERKGRSLYHMTKRQGLRLRMVC